MMIENEIEPEWIYTQFKPCTFCIPIKKTHLNGPVSPLESVSVSDMSIGLSINQFLEVQVNVISLKEPIDGQDIVLTIDAQAQENGQKLLEAHRRVRAAAQIKGVTYRVEPKLPADVLGVYVYLPCRGNN